MHYYREAFLRLHLKQVAMGHKSSSEASKAHCNKMGWLSDEAFHVFCFDKSKSRSAFCG